MIHGERLQTRDEAKKHVFDYIEVYYNLKWLHPVLGYLSPEAFGLKLVLLATCLRNAGKITFSILSIQLPMPKSIAIFGEVLFDCFEDGCRILGGAPFNVAWHLQAFGVAPSFISRVGRDDAGEQIRRAMDAWGMSQAYLQLDARHQTGVVAVSLNAGEPSYAILPEQAYDFIDHRSLASVACDVLYHGSLALRHSVSKQAYSQLLARHHGLVFVDVNLRAPWWRLDSIASLLHEADWVKLNQDELAQLQQQTVPLADAMQAFIDTYRLQGLLVTLGEKGAVCRLASGEEYAVEPETNIDVVDCVGAGDAFSAVMLLGLASNWPLATTLMRAQEFASALVGQRGATVADAVFYRRFIEAWID